MQLLAENGSTTTVRLYYEEEGLTRAHIPEGSDGITIRDGYNKEREEPYVMISVRTSVEDQFLGRHLVDKWMRDHNLALK